MKRYLLLVSTTASEPNDSIMLEVSATSEAAAAVIAQGELIARGFDPIQMHWISDWQEDYSAPVVTFKDTA